MSTQLPVQRARSPLAQNCSWFIIPSSTEAANREAMRIGLCHSYYYQGAAWRTDFQVPARLQPYRPLLVALTVTDAQQHAQQRAPRKMRGPRLLAGFRRLIVKSVRLAWTVTFTFMAAQFAAGRVQGRCRAALCSSTVRPHMHWPQPAVPASRYRNSCRSSARWRENRRIVFARACG